MLCLATFLPQHSSIVMTVIMWSSKPKLLPKIFTIYKKNWWSLP